MRYYVGSDQVGSPRVVFKGDGTVVKQIAYDAFGGVTADSDPSFALPIGFAGGLADPATGLVRFGLRDYDPASGRFTARDPIFFDGSPTNLYAYANSDPASLRDPTGMWCVGASFYEASAAESSTAARTARTRSAPRSASASAAASRSTRSATPPRPGRRCRPSSRESGARSQAPSAAELDLDCFNVKGSLKAGTAVGVGVGIDTDGNVSGTYGGSGKEDFNGRGVRNEQRLLRLQDRGQARAQGLRAVLMRARPGRSG